jgi:hypothetical protein
MGPGSYLFEGNRRLKEQLQRELCGARTTQSVQCALPAAGAAAAQSFVRRGIYKAKARDPKLGVWLVVPWGSEHGMVEHIEIFGTHIELHSFRDVETAAQRDIGLVDPIGAAQTVPGVISLRS